MEMKEQALSIIEAYCGESFSNRKVSERIHLKSKVGRLTHSPILRIDSVKARASQWAHSTVFGATEWQPIDPNEIIIEKNHVVVPGGVLDAHYTEAEVEYTLGFSELPEEIAQARDLLAAQLEGNGTRSAYSLSAFISPEIAHLLNQYRERRTSIG